MHLSKSLSLLRVCLFGGKIRWMKNFGEKMNLCVFWLEEGERKLLCGVQAFSTRAHKNPYLQNGEKIGEKMLEAYCVTKIPSLFIALTYPSHFPTSCDLINLIASSSLSLRAMVNSRLFFFFFFCLVLVTFLILLY